jgi:hypothetical protein
VPMVSEVSAPTPPRRPAPPRRRGRVARSQIRNVTACMAGPPAWRLSGACLAVMGAFGVAGGRATRPPSRLILF